MAGSGAGDFDFYAVELRAGQTLIADTDTPAGELDTMIFVFDAWGNEVEFNDDYDGRDSRVEFTPWESGTYYVAVAGFWNEPWDPFDSGSGDGFGSEGPYDITITAQ